MASLLARLVLPLALAAPAAAPPLTPDARGEPAPDRPFDVEKLQLDLAVDLDAGSVAGTATLTVRRLHPGPLVLDEIGLDIRGVTVDGKAVVWQTGRDQIAVPVDGSGVAA